MSYKFKQIRARRREEGKEPGLVDAGFTLIELLIVIVVLGILAAVVIFALGNVTQSSAASACKSDVKSVETAVEVFHTQNGAWPAVGSDLATTGLGPDLRTWPDNPTHYTISVAANGEVDVTHAGTGQTAVNADNATNPCDTVP